MGPRRYDSPIEWLSDYKSDLAINPGNKHWEKIMHQHYASEWHDMLLSRVWKRYGDVWAAEAREWYKLKATRHRTLAQVVNNAIKTSQARAGVITELKKAKNKALTEDMKPTKPRVDNTGMKYNPRDNSVHIFKKVKEFVPVCVDLTSDSEETKNEESDSDYICETEDSESGGSLYSVSMSELDEMIDPLAHLDEEVKLEA